MPIGGKALAFLFFTERTNFKMSERREKIKQHFIGHKEAYIAGVSCFIAGVVTCYVLKNKQTQVVDSYKLVQYKSPHVSQTIMAIPPRGNRGNVIVNVNDPDEHYSSIRDAAKQLGVSPAQVRAHLSGKKPLINGETYKNLGENLSERLKVA